MINLKDITTTNNTTPAERGFFMTIPELHQHLLNSTGVSTDTRSIKPGNIYFALKGDNFDGNRFTSEAFKNGAVLCVIDNPEFEGENTILVEDVLSTLQELGKYHRRQLSIPVIGLTGSNGKTTTKELLAAVLTTRYKVAYTLGNLNNHIGVPLTLLSISDEHEIAIIEMGANHQKEIEFLCSLSQPDYGYITNFGKAHLEGFGGVEGVIKGKSELYDFIRQSGKGVFVYAEDQIQLEKTKGIRRVTFGEPKDSDYSMSLVRNLEARETIAVEFEGRTIQTHLTGNYNFSNVGAAIAIGKFFDVAVDDIKRGIEQYTPQNNRSQLQKTDRNMLVVDTYNANPSSVEQALLNFRDFPAEHKWVILGDMFEMGEYEAEEHQKMADIALRQNFERVLLAGKAFSHVKLDEKQTPKQFKNSEDLLTYLRKEKPSGKTILIKGSRGMKLERAIEFL